jgi:DNA-binding NarL/FixJ family response regulator
LLDRSPHLVTGLAIAVPLRHFEKGFAMRPINVVLAHHDAVSAEHLAASLQKHFRNLAVAKSLEEARSAIARLRAPFAVVDLELIRIPELKQVCAQFPSTAIVCIHRLADDALWSEALAMGAVDCCHAGDLHGILLAAERYVVLARAHPTAA